MVYDSTQLIKKMDPLFAEQTYLDDNDSGKRDFHKGISSGGTDPSSGYNYALIGCDFSLMLTSLHGRPDSASITRNQLSPVIQRWSLVSLPHFLPARLSRFTAKVTNADR